MPPFGRKKMPASTDEPTGARDANNTYLNEGLSRGQRFAELRKLSEKIPELTPFLDLWFEQAQGRTSDAEASTESQSYKNHLRKINALLVSKRLPPVTTYDMLPLVPDDLQ